MNKYRIGITADSSIEQLMKLVNNTDHDTVVSGKVQLDINIQAPENMFNNAFFSWDQWKNVSLEGSLLFKDMQTGIGSLASLARLTFAKNSHILHGKLYWQHNNGLMLSGDWQYNQQTHCGRSDVSNTTTSLLSPTSYWCLPAYKTQMHAEINASGMINGSYESMAYHRKLETYQKTNGTFSVNPSYLCMLAGDIDDNHYKAQIQLYPEPQLQELVYYDAGYKKQIDIHAINDDDIQESLQQEDTLFDDEQKVAVYVDFDFIKNSAHAWG